MAKDKKMWEEMTANKKDEKILKFEWLDES